MVTPLVEQSLDPCLRILALPLRMLAAPPILLRGGDGLPAGALHIPAARLILAATPCDAPMFRDAARAACVTHDRDILLVRSGLFPETFDPVAVDVFLVGPDGPLMLSNLSFLRRADRLWLVPDTSGPSVEIASSGLELALELPFADPEERSDGLCRAAADIVRLTARRRRR